MCFASNPTLGTWKLNESKSTFGAGAGKSTLVVWENSGPTYRMSEMLRNRGIAYHLDDWGPEDGHEWPYWHHQMWEYVGAHF